MNIIKLLGIEYKEDIISNLLVAFIKKSESFKKEFIENLIGIDFNEITDLDISIRTKTSVGIPDIVLYINTRNKSKLVVIENKLKAKEGVNQTLRYSDKQCIKELLEKSKLILYKDNVEFIGLFLTLVPERNYTGEVFKNITYKDILNKIECKIEDRTLDKLYRDFREVLNEFYNNLDVDCNESILEIFKKETDAERAIIKFTKIIKSINLNNGLISYRDINYLTNNYDEITKDSKLMFYLKFNIALPNARYLHGMTLEQLSKVNVKHINKLSKFLEDKTQDELSTIYKSLFIPLALLIFLHKFYNVFYPTI